ncbi:unnamed protein product [Menidia menidia]|uniref:(Atlantic silverside) hypothetical protein n=1 Tax=Menidia menidia TaxID=238744 RepID=A0A8S4ATF9_9TELE|nr:unnamed protein product [Menidia menidia]
MHFGIVLIFSGAVLINAESHKLCYTYGCSDSSDTQLLITLDDDEVCYADFKKEIDICDNKIQTTARNKLKYELAQRYRLMCKHDIYRWKPDKTATRTKEPPETVIYPRDEVIEEEDNTLICFTNKFFPPLINIKWTKNDEEVTVEDAFIKSIANPDGTFHVFSYLNFIPKQGDIYSCTVEHEALEELLTRFWEVETEEKSRGPAIFCVLGIVVGLLEIAAGAFFFVKGNPK